MLKIPLRYTKYQKGILLCKNNKNDYKKSNKSIKINLQFKYLNDIISLNFRKSKYMKYYEK